MVDANLIMKHTRHVHVHPDKYVLHLDNASSVAVIDRASHKVSMQSASQYRAPISATDIIPCFGVVGIVKLLACPYLIVISECSLVGRIRKSPIFLIKKVKFLPFAANPSLSAARFVGEDKQYMQMFDTVVDYGAFYFAFDFDITHSMQRIAKFDADTLAKPLWARADNRFVWNSWLLEEFTVAGADDWAVPIMNGFFQCEHINLRGVDFDFVLVSRRDHRRTGTRFHIRGLDHKGNAANFAETEQIVVVRDGRSMHVSSFLQTRGSMPMLWQQKPNMKYTPRGRVIGDPTQSQMAANAHIREQTQLYTENVLVNLVDKKGFQKELGEAMATHVNKAAVAEKAPAHYVWFDFHHECRKMKWHNLSKLVDMIKSKMDAYGFFLMREDMDGSAPVVEKEQSGVFRTNCVDCLDRTNVVQSVFARRSLHAQLHQLGLLPVPKGEPFEEFPARLEMAFRNMWADNADVMSFLYSGTGALKTDFTRLGKRTKQGAIQDGRNSIVRYFKNNFMDGYRQDCTDFCTGKYQPSVKANSPLRKRGNKLNVLFVGALLYVMLAFVLVSAVQEQETVQQTSTSPSGAITVTTVALPKQYAWNPLVSFIGNRVAAGVGSVLLFLGLGKIVMGNGKKFVDNPRLLPNQI